MTPAQLTTLSTAIAADPTLVALGSANGFPQIAAAFNAPSSPAVSVWIPNIPSAAILADIQVADMAGMTAAQLAYLQMLLTSGTVDATSAAVRTNFSSLFAAKPTLTALTTTASRTATRWEALNTTAAVCSTFGASVAPSDVQSALGK